MLRYLIVLFVLSFDIQLTDTRKPRSKSVYQYQSTNDNGGVQMVDVIQNSNGGRQFQSIDSHGNVQSFNEGHMGFNVNVDGVPMTINLDNYPSGNVEVISANGNKIISTSRNIDYDDEYYDDSVPIRHYANLMKNFMSKIYRKYNQGTNPFTGDPLPEYIFVHYYAGEILTPQGIKFSPRELSTCPKVDYCLEKTRPLCIGETTYCVAPLRRTTPCERQYNNGKLPCIETSIINQATTKEPIVIPCITTLIQIGKKKRYCATMIVVNTHLQHTMQKVHQSVQTQLANTNQMVQTQLANARKMVQNGINAGNVGFMQGMETLHQAMAGLDRNMYLR